VIQRKSGTFLRHARNIPAHRVVDEPLDHFIARNQRYPWKVDGVSLLEVLPHRPVIAMQAKAGR
jgi:hypothetical protein